MYTSIRSAFFLFVSVIVLASAACQSAAPPVTISNKPSSVNGVPQPSGGVSAPTKPLPEMSWTKFDSSVEKLRDYRGRAVVLDFWATYCVPCLEAIPHLRALQEKHGRNNIAIIGLHVGGAEDRPKVPAFKDKLKIDYTLAEPEQALVNFVFGSESAIPQAAVFNREGQLVEKFVGFNSEIAAKLDAAVEEALKQ